MSILASDIIKQARAWVGCNEADGTHKKIINTYNAHRPLARSYKVKYTDAWCATFVSAVAIKCGATSIIPTECGCEQMIALFKKLWRWIERDDYTPKPGDIVFYDWGDSGKGDCGGYADHVGIVEVVNGSTITVIEGNYKNAVSRRRIMVNSRYIRGYGVPRYDAEPAAPADTCSVLEWQLAAIADGFSFPKYGADGKFGAECASVAKIAIVKKRESYKYENLTRIVQRAVGVNPDGKCGAETDEAIRVYQGRNELEEDGEVGLETWGSILGVTVC